MNSSADDGMAPAMRRSVFLSVVAALVSSAIGSDALLPRLQAAEDTWEDLPKELRAVVASPAPRTFAEAMSRIPTVYKRNFAGVKGSMSMQPSTDKEPRILMFDPARADLVLSISGSALSQGLHREEIEFMYWSQARKRPVFGSLEPVRGASGEVAYELRSATEKGCVSCHSNGNMITSISEWPFHEAKRFVAEKCPTSSCDEQGRCGGEGTASIGSDLYRHLDCQGFLAKVERGRGSMNPMFEHRMKAISRRRSITLFKKLPVYPRIKYTLLAAMSSCSGFQGRFLPESHPEALPDLKEAIALERSYLAVRRDGVSDPARLAELDAQEQQIVNIEAIAYTLQAYGGLSWKATRDWIDVAGATMDCDLSFTAQIGELLDGDWELGDFMSKHRVTPGLLVVDSGCRVRKPITERQRAKLDAYCETLAKVSRQRLGSL